MDNPKISIAVGLVFALGASAAVAAPAELESALASVAPASCPSVDPKAITLSAFLGRATCIDPAIQTARATRQRLEQAVVEARSPLAWQLDVQVGPSGSLQSQSGRDLGTLTGAASVGGSKRLFDGGATRARVSAAQRQVLVADADVRSAHQDSVRTSIETWADLREAQGRVFAATRALDAARQSRTAVDARVAVGLSTRLEALTAASAVAQAERELLTARTTELAALGVLAERVGWAANAQLALVGDGDTIVDSLTTLIGHDDPMSLLAGHPRLVAQRERIAGRDDAVAAARADERASVVLSASTGPRLSRSNATSPTGSYQESRSWNHEVALTWALPISDGGSRSSRVAQATASLNGERAAGADLERALRSSVWEQWTTWRGAGAGLTAAQAALAAARAAEEGQRARYTAGTGTLTEWLSAQSDLADRIRQLATAEQTVLRSAARAAHALGRLDALDIPK